jgi:Ni2+-binding GTPase involved in maturation of urease and hydrogenase
MYGFGDEFHVAPDTVSVMEEILIEYIGNLVCLLHLSFDTIGLSQISVQQHSDRPRKHAFRQKT